MAKIEEKIIETIKNHLVIVLKNNTWVTCAKTIFDASCGLIYKFVLLLKVPFGDPHYVKHWLKITGNIGKPVIEHPNRPILGWESTRTEVSGSRFWGFMEKYSKIPENFFSSCFVHNYCPLVFMNETGKNITPNNIPACQRKELFSLCDNALKAVVQLLDVQMLVCLGKFVESRCNTIFKDGHIQIAGLMHPSPANPKANADWENIALKQLQESGAMSYIIS